MKMTFKYNFIKSILGGWPVILGLAFTFFTHFSFADEVLDEQVYSNLTEQELEAATVNLVLALENNIIAGAGLDVFEFEPKVNKKLMNMDNVVLMPHAGSATYKTRMGMIDLACTNIVNYLVYNKYDNLVNKEIL